MKVYRGNDTQPDIKNTLATIGNFDGVHRGHQGVLHTLSEWARQSGHAPGVITFGEHPRKTLNGHAPDLVTTLEHRLVLFERARMGFVWVVAFTPELARLTARQFAEEYFVKRLGLRGLVLGFDSVFGSDLVRQDSPELRTLAAALDFELRLVPPVLTPDGEAISSTRIREAIFDGRLRDAEVMLGRHVSVYGTVIPGDARGRRLGYHTANLDLGEEVRPPFGVYATLALIEGRRRHSITNVGYRPTIQKVHPPGSKPDLLIETHLFDFTGDLYGKKMEVLFIEKLRDERRFPDVDALVEQIKKDEAKARAILEAYSS